MMKMTTSGDVPCLGRSRMRVEGEGNHRTRGRGCQVSPPPPPPPPPPPHDDRYHQVPEKVQEGEALPRWQVAVQAHQGCRVHSCL